MNASADWRRRWARIAGEMAIYYEKDLEAHLPDGAAPETRLVMYERLLGDLPIALVDAACEIWMRRRGAFFPKASEIRDTAETEIARRAGAAWGALEALIGAHGPYRPVTLHDGATGTALQAVFGGWPQACERWAHAPDRWIATRPEFLDAYRAAVLSAQETKDLPGTARAALVGHGLPARVAEARTIIADLTAGKRVR